MANRKSPPASPAARRGGASSRSARSTAPDPAAQGLGSAMSTMSGPAQLDGDPLAAASVHTEAQLKLLRRALGTQALAQAMPSNRLKAAEYGRAQAFEPLAGEPLASGPDEVTASTVTEGQASHKVGDGLPECGYNADMASLCQAARPDPLRCR